MLRELFDVWDQCELAPTLGAFRRDPVRNRTTWATYAASGNPGSALFTIIVLRSADQLCPELLKKWINLGLH
jgi:hypothetical protein